MTVQLEAPPQRERRTDTPWRFLSALDGDDPEDRALIRRTRGDELSVISSMISASRVSLLYSASGNGKSSLVAAGVVPQMLERGYAVFTTRPRPPFRRDNPTRAFKECVRECCYLPMAGRDDLRDIEALREQLQSVPDLATAEVNDLLGRLEDRIEQLQKSFQDRDRFRSHIKQYMSAPLLTFVGAIRDYIDSEAKILFVCDQFEELFVHFSNSAPMQAFIEELGSVWREPGLRTHFMFSMREDWVGSMIEFRSVIPDIFTHYYKLNPIRSKQAGDVLTMPLELREIAIPDGVTSRIIGDLTAEYSRNQADRRNLMNLPLSPTDDPYLELPALQVVADRMWRSRHEHQPPFTMEHYEGLVDAKPAAKEDVGTTVDTEEQSDVSPARYLLRTYLDEILSECDNPAPFSADQWRELRLDALYQLTDRMRHRRALGGTVLLEETVRIRPSALNLPAVDMATLRSAMSCLVRQGIVRRPSTADEPEVYELAHDFAVRSVVTSWRALDRQRTAEIAVRRREQNKERERLDELVAKELRAVRFVEAAPLAGMLLAAVSVFGAVVDAPYTTRYFLIPALFAGLLVGVVGLTMKLRASALWGWTFSASAVLAYAYTPTYDYYEYTMPFIPYVLAALVLAHIPLYLYSLVQNGSDLQFAADRVHKRRIMFAEYVDLVVVGGLMFGGYWAARAYDSQAVYYTYMAVPFMLIAAVMAWTGFFADFIRQKSTTGYRAVGLVLQRRGGQPVRWPRAAGRTTLLLVAALLNVYALIPFILLTALWYFWPNRASYLIDSVLSIEAVPGSREGARRTVLTVFGGYALAFLILAYTIANPGTKYDPYGDYLPTPAPAPVPYDSAVDTTLVGIDTLISR
jgi:hypothetical protein